MSKLKYLNTLLLEVTVSFRHEHLFIGDLGDHTVQIIIETCWASMNVDSKRSITSKHSSNAAWLLVYLPCRLEETGMPRITCSICHQVLHHPSEHETSSMVQYLLEKAHIMKLNQVKEWTVTELTN